MRYIKYLLLTAIVFLISITPVFPQNILTIGNDAPAIKYTKWIKGTPVDKLEKGKIYVVEFWATWCTPCRQTIPELTVMAHKFKDKITFIGAAIGERGADEKSIIEHVTEFVEKMGDKMDYNILLDTKDGFMSKNWMGAAEQNAIPAAFIIDAGSKIVWIGYPSKQMDEVLNQLLEGKYDGTKLAAETLANQKKNLKRTELLGRFNAVSKDLMEAKKAGDNKKIIEECEKIVNADPELTFFTDNFYAEALAATNPDKAIAEAEKVSKSEDSFLTYINTFINKKGNEKLTNYAIESCNQMLKKDEKNLNIMYLLIAGYEQTGNKEKAIDILEKFISAAEDKGISENDLQEFINKLKKLKEDE